MLLDQPRLKELHQDRKRKHLALQSQLPRAHLSKDLEVISLAQLENLRAADANLLHHLPRALERKKTLKSKLLS